MFDRDYNRILLKISGESFKGKLEYGHSFKAINAIIDDIIEADQAGVQICLVVGGGNFYRGSQTHGIERATADYISMLATVMNALALQDLLEKKGVKSKVLSSIPMETVCETYCKTKALMYMDDGYIVIFAGGTGNPFVSTDTSAVFRAIEMRCDAMLKGTQVEGVYSDDPNKNKNAEKYDVLKYDEIIDKKLKVMDLSAVCIAQEHSLPMLVFSIQNRGDLKKVLDGNGTFTLIK